MAQSLEQESLSPHSTTTSSNLQLWPLKVHPPTQQKLVLYLGMSTINKQEDKTLKEMANGSILPSAQLILHSA